MIRARLLAPAEHDLDECASFYESKSVGLGSDFIDEVEHLIERLLRFPSIAPIYVDDFRSAQLPRFPFNLIYRIERQEIVIVAIAHQSRRPGYWRGRAD